MKMPGAAFQRDERAWIKRHKMEYDGRRVVFIELPKSRQEPPQ